MSSFSPQAYRARWIVPMEGAPVENGVLLVEAGRIVSVLPRTTLPVTDLGEVALIPGLVNAHTHLEFSSLTEPFDTQPRFTDWLLRVIAYRRTHPHGVSAAIRAGLQESARHGVTLVGDIATHGWIDADYAQPNCPRVVLFQELLGLASDRIPALRTLAEDHLTPKPGSQVRPALSPHATYSVHPDVLQHAVRFAAARRDGCLAIHVAEFPAERELLEQGVGELRKFLEAVGAWQPQVFGGRSFQEFLEGLADVPHGLLIHGNHLNSRELMFVAQHPHVTLVYCPRTHAAFGHPPHPWLRLLELGGSVAIGTDSRASNPDLSLWSELQFLAAGHPTLLPHHLLKLGTLAGARALGCGSECGSLVAGKRADVAVIELRDPAFRDPTYDILAPGNRVAGTMLAGEWIVAPTALC